ncbi:MAG TPA: sugar transferase [Gaiellaceae bacterium]|nr:sugar transferase [Gaiellaceae bacterium]
MKRAFDLVVASALLIVLSPLAAVALVAMALDMLVSRRDRGSVLYREQRVSRGRTFDLLKLRTLRAEVLATAGGHARLLERDPSNLTWAGRRILKPWYLDELPQLLNVLRGDISLVGPRPWPPPLVERQVAEGYDYRNRVAAGLTGPSQVAKGAGRAFLDLDLEYVDALERLSGWQIIRRDLRILRRTIGVLARGEGLEY